jgi:hypothetical protein
MLQITADATIWLPPDSRQIDPVKMACSSRAVCMPFTAMLGCGYDSLGLAMKTIMTGRVFTDGFWSSRRV